MNLSAREYGRVDGTCQIGCQEDDAFKVLGVSEEGWCARLVSRVSIGVTCKGKIIIPKRSFLSAPDSWFWKRKSGSTEMSDTARPSIAGMLS